MALTEKTLLQLPTGRHSDGRGTGLALLVRGPDSRFWVQRLRIRGKVRELGHGSLELVGLSAARRAAADAKRVADAGGDPVADRKAAKAPKAGGTLQDAVDGYVTAHGPSWRSEKTRKQFSESLKNHAAKLLRMRVEEIAIEDVRAALAPIWTTKPVMAQKVRSRLEAALEWAIAAKWRAAPNPAAWRGGLRPLLAKPSAVTRNRHHPALHWARVPAFLTELRDHAGGAARCLEFAILTAVRSGEARGARWEEIDLGGGVWSIPAARMKADAPHDVPLSASALAVLRSLLPADGKKPKAGPIFVSPRGKSYSDMALLKVVQTLHADSIAAGCAGWLDKDGARITPHGFRSSFRDWCGDTGQDRELAEAALAHAVGNETERAYARSRLLDRRRVLMETWGRACEGEGPAPGRLRVVA